MEKPNQVMVWHPDVHARFQEGLVFFLIKVRVFEKSKLYSRLEEYIKDKGFAGYRIFQVFGIYDVVLRIWLPKGVEWEVKNQLERLGGITKALPFLVGGIPHHWFWGKKQSDPQALNRLTSVFVTNIQRELSSNPGQFLRDAPAMTEKNLLKLFDHPRQASAPRIKFFSFLTLSDSTTNLIDDKLPESVVKIIEKFSSEVHHASVYEGTGFAWYLVKGEVEDFFAIRWFVDEINETISHSGLITMTSVVADKEFPSCDYIGQASFDKVGQKDLAVAAIIPELYTSANVPEDKRLQIEDWVRRHASPTDISDEDQDIVGECLSAVLRENEEALVNTMASIFRITERKIRDAQVELMKSAIALHKVESGETLDHTQFIALAFTEIQTDGRNKRPPEVNDPKHLTLGDRLRVLWYCLIKCKAEVTKGEYQQKWQEIVALRNTIVHGLDDLLPTWTDRLKVFTEFLSRRTELADLVKGCLPPNTATPHPPQDALHGQP